MEQNDRDAMKGIGLQFFAESPDDPPADPPAEPPTEPTAHDEPPAGKTYTQGQLNSMMANEKRTARQAILKELGFDIKDDKSFKDTLKNIKATLDAGKTQAQLDAEAKAAAETAKAEAETKAAKLEMKVAALAAGVNPEFLDDIIVLAQSKVSETMTVEKVMEEFKTKYPSFFAEASGGSGTGRSNNPPRKPPAGTEGLGQRLAKVNKPTAKSSYFKN
jgi:hypothetical protein